MARRCTVCAHAERGAIERALVGLGVGADPFRHIALRFGVSTTALQRHKADHLPVRLLAARAAQDTAEAVDVMGEVRRLFVRVNLLFDACHDWLTDANDGTRYDLGPRAGDVLVTYEESAAEGERPRRRKESLAVLLGRLDQAGLTVVATEYRHADPRELVLKAAGQLQGQIDLLAKLVAATELEERLSALELQTERRDPTGRTSWG